MQQRQATSPMWGLASWNFIALLFGVIAVIALYFSATEADRRAVSLEKEAAEARLKLAEIENLTAWRRIRPDQREQIIQAIRNDLPALIVIGFEQADPEATTFAIDLEAVFKGAGATDVRRQGNAIYIGGDPLFGLFAKYSAEFKPDTVEAAFGKAGFPFTRRPELPLPFGVGSPSHFQNPSDKRSIGIYLYVGHKPPAQ
jgi:hypothetical protein